MSENANGASKAPKAVIETTLDAGAFDADENAAGAGSAEAGQVGSGDGGAKTGAKSRSFQTATIGFFEGVGRVAWAFADSHPHATLYGMIGFALAVLILIIGLWRTLVIALFVGVGAAIGHAIDRNRTSGTVLDRFLNGGK